ncbi:hypothetical protein C9374_008614 [Naegleria lovaniensis]|uniref:Uncharacterized protein n=1 Tax=Naegleria lovaniensis TaxID=51637 RepID=A0AA88GEI1_NAELO|nr:uncharacterized protein C9374_008614 [Naegleria lovaniensis]KAG2377992.1 hypothetical protein C9374_008614 [Naegleria lovaniensis]
MSLDPNVLKRKRVVDQDSSSKKLKGSVPSSNDMENTNPNLKPSKIPIPKHSQSTSLNSSSLSSNNATTTSSNLKGISSSNRTSIIRANATSRITTNRLAPSSTPSSRVSQYQKPSTTNSRQSVSRTMTAPQTAKQTNIQKQEHETTKHELDQTKSQLSQLSDENKQLKSKIDEQLVQLQDLIQLEEKTKSLETLSLKYQEDSIQLKSINKTQEIEIHALKGLQEKLQMDNIDLRVKVSSLEKEIEIEKKQSEMDKATLKIQYESEIRIQKEHFEQQLNEVTEIKDKEHNLTKERLTKEVSRVKSELDRVQFELNCSIDDANTKSEKIRELEAKIHQQLEHIQNLENKRHHDESERRRLHNIIQELKGNIRVYCRVKPAQEIKCISYPDADVDERSINIQEDSRVTATGASAEGKKYYFQFDKVFKPNSTQKEIFYEISQLVQSALDGFKVCIFAYGQTGSGKTYTMEGPPKDLISNLDSEKQEALAGMIPRSVDQIFESAEKLKEKGWTFTIVASFLEIYNETIRDLLDSTNKDNVKYDIKHGKDGSTTVTGLKYVNVNRPQQVQELLRIASKNRAVAATLSNDRSSRSHSVFTLQITGRNDNTDQTTQGVLNLVDLAGSERISNNHPTNSDRIKETQNINLSLTCLSSVVTALANKASYVPYRDSKLTFLLQNCLGGDAKTLMFVNIDPENPCLSSLQPSSFQYFHITLLDFTMATELTPQQISVSFVAQYYYILSSNTKNLYKFYKNESEMTHEHSNVVKQLPGNINPNTVVGQDIEKKISTLGYEDCKVRLTFVDSQRSLNGSVFVFVEGVMIRQSDDQKEMNFVQTFLLAEQENGYYVRNDYLRFTSCASSVTPSTVPHQVTSTISHPQHHAINASNSTDTQVKSQNGSTNLTPPQLSFSTNTSVANTAAANGSHSPRSETSSTAATAGASSVYGGAEDNQLDEESDHEESKQSEKKSIGVNVPSQSSSNTASLPPVASSTRVEKPSESHKSISYAAAVKNEQSSATSAPSTTVPQEASQQPKRGKKHHKNENKEKVEHKEDNEQKGELKNEQKKSDHQKIEPKNRKHEHNKSENDQKKPPSVSASTDEQKNNQVGERKEKSFRGKDHPLNKYAVYVRDLPVGTRDSDLKQVFASYGNIIDIHNKSGKDQSYNKYALIFFETKQSVDTLLEKPTVNIEGHECPITRYQRKPKPHFTPRGTSPNNTNNTVGASNNVPNQNRPSGERRPQRQRFARAPANTETSVEK